LFLRAFRDVLLTDLETRSSSEDLGADEPCLLSPSLASCEELMGMLSSNTIVFFCNCLRDAGCSAASTWTPGVDDEAPCCDSRYLHTVLKSPKSTSGLGSAKEMRSTAGGDSRFDLETDKSDSGGCLVFLDFGSFMP
jgi:hypothetical protein